MIQLKDHMKVNKQKVPSEDASIPLVKKKAITSQEGGRELEVKWTRHGSRERGT